MKHLLLALLLTLPTMGLAQDTALTEARTLLNQGKAQEVIARLQALPPDARTQHLLGVAYYRTNDYVKAIATLTPLYTALPQDSAERKEAVQALGMAHYVLGHLAEAVPFLEQTLAWSPSSNELQYALGMACIQTRQEAKGRAAFARLFRVAADSPAAHLFAAQMMIRVELNEQAEAELKQALAKNPKLPQAHFLLGVIEIQKSRFDEAVVVLEKEIELNPGNAMAFYRLGDAYTRQLQWDEAIPALQKSVWLNPYFSGPYILLGKSYLKKRELTNAEGMLRRALQMDPNNKSAHYMLAQLLQQTGRADEAKREFAIAEKLQGSNDQPEK
jgi:tetratricopeptide (TPR) repeat protein